MCGVHGFLYGRGGMTLQDENVSLTVTGSPRGTGLPPSEAGEFADFTVRAAALLKASATECIGMGSIRKRPPTSAAFSASFSGRHARHCLSLASYDQPTRAG